MDGLHHAAACQQGSENRHDKGKDDQHHIPDLQHAFLFLDHDGMQKRGPMSQGIIEAFSTGSHAQKPPQPSSWYAHLPPSMIPMLRNIHATIVQRRVVRIHVSPTCLVIMAAMANAKGTAKPTKPRYSIGG